jgi:hypothetical protein
MNNSDRDPETGISLVDGPVENPDVPSTPQEEVKLRRVKRWLSGTLSQKNLMLPQGSLLFRPTFTLRDGSYVGRKDSRRTIGREVEVLSLDGQASECG